MSRSEQIVGRSYAVVIAAANLSPEARRKLLARPCLGCSDHFKGNTVGVKPSLGRATIGTMEIVDLVAGDRLCFDHLFVQVIWRIGDGDGKARGGSGSLMAVKTYTN